MKHEKTLLAIAEYLRNAQRLPLFAEAIEETVKDYKQLQENTKQPGQ